MSDNDTPMLPNLPPQLSDGFDPVAMEQMDRSCQQALQNQLNKNERDPRLKALADKWKTMDHFSKRELGQQDVKSADVVKSQQRPVTAQLAPGQKVEVTGPATIYGGDIEVVKPQDQEPI